MEAHIIEVGIPINNEIKKRVQTKELIQNL